MPDNTKDPKPKKFVSSELTEETETPSKDEVPKVSSFSQLDASKSDTKASTGETTPKTDSTDTVEASDTKETESSSSATSLDQTLESGEEKEDKPQKDMSSEDIKDWLKDVRPDTNKEVEKKGGPNFNILLILVLITAVLGALVGGAIYYKKGVSTTEVAEPTNSETQTATFTPSPEPQASVDLSTFSVSVLNGSGVAGEAAKVKDLLTQNGFDEEKVKTGNADSTDYTSTTVSVKEGLDDSVFTAVEESLAEVYEVAKSEDTLDSNSTYDIIIIVGDRLE